jgi:hypothetical protein
LLLKNSVFSFFDTSSFEPVFQKSSGVGTVYFDVPYEGGDRFTSLQIELLGDGAVDTTIELDYSLAGTGTSITDYNSPLGGSLGTLTQNNVPASWSYYLVSNTALIMPAGASLIARVSVNAANLQIGLAKATYDRL